MMSARGCPDELVFTRQRHQDALATSRMQVEIQLVEEWCTALKPKFFASPHRSTNGIDGIEYTVELTEGTLFGTRHVTLQLEVPEHYPSEIPRIYIPQMEYPRDWDGNAHMYRDSQNMIHMCIFFPEDWTMDHTLACMMVRSTVWLNKYVIYRETGVWPGKGQAHCPRCGKRRCEC